MLGKMVTVVIDRPLGSCHPEHPEMIYPVNYGFVEGVFAADGEEQDVYVIGVSKPLETFTGKVIAVIRRKNDVEDKWVAAPLGLTFSKAEIMELVEFQERFFEIEIIMQ